jgi:GT2 family glycosyltransferase
MSIPIPPPVPDARPLVSVIMPCFNAGRFVEQAVRCALSQSHSNIEVIVVDDGSTDDSVEILERLQASFGPDRLTLLQTRHGGPYPARNRGLQQARGEWIAFLDADDYWAENCIESLLQGARAQDADLAYCGWQNVGDVPAGGDPYVPPDYAQSDMAVAFLKTCPWPIHAALVRHAVVRAIDGFSTRRFASMDYDFWLRVFAHTRRMVRVPEVLAFYRWHGAGQISAIKWRQVIDAWTVRRDFVRQHGDRVAHLPRQQLVDLVDGALLRAAYAAFWKRDLVSAQRLFRRALLAGGWRLKDLGHILPSLLPQALFRRLVTRLER